MLRGHHDRVVIPFARLEGTKLPVCDEEQHALYVPTGTSAQPEEGLGIALHVVRDVKSPLCIDRAGPLARYRRPQCGLLRGGVHERPICKHATHVQRV